MFQRASIHSGVFSARWHNPRTLPSFQTSPWLNLISSSRPQAFPARLSNRRQQWPKRQGVVRLGTSAARLFVIADDTATRQEICTWGEQNLVDTAFVPAGSRLADCKVLAMDMDSTLINIECIDEIAAYGGVKEQVASITEVAMRGEIKDFAESLTRRVAFYADCPPMPCRQSMSKSCNSTQAPSGYCNPRSMRVCRCCLYRVDSPISLSGSRPGCSSTKYTPMCWKKPTGC